MSILLMKDPKKLASLIIERRGKQEPAPKTEDGALKDHSAGHSDAAMRLLEAVSNKDAESFIKFLKLTVRSMVDEGRDDSSKETSSDLPSIDDLARK